MYLIIALAVPVIIYILVSRLKTYKNLPPGPEAKGILGNFKDLDRDKVHQSLDELAKKYGRIVYLRILSKRIVVLNSAGIIRKAFADDNYAELLNDKPRGFYGTYLLWGHQEILFGQYTETTFKLKAAMHAGIKHAMAEHVIGAELQQLVDVVTAMDGADVNVKDIIGKVFADSTACTLIGEAKSDNSALMWEFIKWSNEIFSPTTSALLQNFPFLRWLPCQPGVVYQRALKSRDALVTRFFTDGKESYTAGSTRGLVDTCFGIQATEVGSDGLPWLSDDMIKALIIDTIGAGLVATTSAVVASILALLHNSKCMHKMVAEISTVIGRDRLPSIVDQSRMPYCHAVVLEVLRFSSVVPLVNHYCSKADVQLEGYVIPKDTIVWGNIWSAHHDDSWSDPWIFRPDRFLTQQGSLLPEGHLLRQSLFPFGLGSRVCVGDKFASVRIFLYITTLVQRFRILPPVDRELLPHDPRQYTSGPVLQIDNLYCRLVPQ